MREILKTLCDLPGVSGREDAVRDWIFERIRGCCDCTVDRAGNLIARKKGAKRAARSLMIDAHTDEVGIIVTAVTEEGFLKFEPVGGVDVSVLLAKRIRFEHARGVICVKPVHLTPEDERKQWPKIEDLAVDIGADGKSAAEERVHPGEVGWFDTAAVWQGDRLFAKAIDDRAGCAVLAELLTADSPYDFTGVFSVREEVGLRGAGAAAYTVKPDLALVLEATTAADLPDVPEERQVCKLGGGVALSFLDGRTLYDRKLLETALGLAKKEQIPAQVKAGTSGGNNAGAIHISRGGVPTLALSVPCRYLHAPVSAADLGDINAAKRLTAALIGALCA